MELCETIMLLSSIKGLGKKTLNKINIKELYYLTENNVWDYIIDVLAKKHTRIKPETDRTKQTELLDKTKIIIEQTRQNNIEIIIKYQDNYPKSFLNLDDAPIMFFAQGNIMALQTNSAAIIGTRNVSPLGYKIGVRFGEFLTEHEYTTISGLAEGCDTAGHIGTLNKNGITIAVLPTPINNIYPKSNAKLKDEIISSGGCVISEYPIGSSVSKSNFIERDRLQCGLASGIIAVETGIHGGSMHAINGALKLNKPVGCFSFKPEHYNEYINSCGNRMLIEEHKALPLTNGESIANFLNLCSKKENSNEVEISLF